MMVPYFDPVRARYDTLRSSLHLKVIGESQKNASIHDNEYDSFYQLINKKSNRFGNYRYLAYVKLVANVLLLVMLIATGFIVLRPLKEKYKK